MSAEQKDGAEHAKPTDPPPISVADLSYTEASRELDEIVAYFEHGELDIDELVGRLERATAIVDELDRRLRQTKAQVEDLVPRLEAAVSGERPRSEPDLLQDDVTPGLFS